MSAIEITILTVYCLLIAPTLLYFIVYYPLRHDRKFKSNLQVGQVLLWRPRYSKQDIMVGNKKILRCVILIQCSIL